MGMLFENKKYAYLKILKKKKKHKEQKKLFAFVRLDAVLCFGGQGNSFGVAEVAASGFL